MIGRNCCHLNDQVTDFDQPRMIGSFWTAPGYIIWILNGEYSVEEVIRFILPLTWNLVGNEQT